MTEPYELALENALSILRKARNIIRVDISNYPTPISGCDGHYNVLLSDRTRISKAIDALEQRPFIATPRILERGGVSESR